MVNVAILGHGVVGSGVAEILLNYADKIEKQCGEKVVLKHILDLRDFSNLPYGNLFTDKFDDILNDDIDVIAEVIGGIHPSFDFIKSALGKGISVVTSNKELVATKGCELLALAKKNNCRFLFEASVGGGIPVIRSLMTALDTDEITEIYGILNGTTNYILTEMSKNGVSFGDALKQAQSLGYAERNPDADIKGIDACRKISILADIIDGRNIDPDAIYTEGIENITSKQTETVSKLNGQIKLIGHASRNNGEVALIVSPMAVMSSNPLCHVEGVFNGIVAETVNTGRVTFMGRGAGKLPTAAAVVADIADCVKNHGAKYNVMWQCEDGFAPIDDAKVLRNWLVSAKKAVSCDECENTSIDCVYIMKSISCEKLYEVFGNNIEFALPILF